MMHLAALPDNTSRDIFARLAEFRGFYLAGGTALALQIGHRVSVDFDLFSDFPIASTLLTNAEKTFADFPRSISVNNRDELTLFVSEKKITFFYYPFSVIQPFIEFQGIQSLSIAEIGATKAYTIGRRASYKDYIDLYFVLKENYSTLSDLIALAEKKYGSEFNGRLFLEQLTHLGDVTDDAIVFLREPIEKRELGAYFESEIGKISL